MRSGTVFVNTCTEFSSLTFKLKIFIEKVKGCLNKFEMQSMLNSPDRWTDAGVLT
jgi:hypothetical protein